MNEQRLPPSVAAEAKRILDGAACRIRDERHEAERRRTRPSASEWFEDTAAATVDEYQSRRASE